MDKLITCQGTAYLTPQEFDAAYRAIVARQALGDIGPIERIAAAALHFGLPRYRELCATPEP